MKTFQEQETISTVSVQSPSKRMSVMSVVSGDVTWLPDKEIKVGDLIGIYDDVHIVVELRFDGYDNVAVLDDGDTYVLYENTSTRVFNKRC